MAKAPVKKPVAKKPAAKKVTRVRKPALSASMRVRVPAPPKPRYQPTIEHAPFGFALGLVLIATLGMMAFVVANGISFYWSPLAIP